MEDFKEDLSLEEREAAEGAPPRLRGLSLEEKARVAESGGESWEKSGEWSGGGFNFTVVALRLTYLAPDEARTLAKDGVRGIGGKSFVS